MVRETEGSLYKKKSTDTGKGSGSMHFLKIIIRPISGICYIEMMKGNTFVSTIKLESKGKETK